jgi:heme oxygenase
MLSPSKMLLRLDFETRKHHAVADQPWQALAMGDSSRLRYATYLARVYGFEAPLECAVAYTPDLAIARERRLRPRAGLLAMDLLALGSSPAQIAKLPQCRAIAFFHDHVEALGWLYVTERSTLLHERVLPALLAHRPELAPATAYLSSTSAAAATCWLRLGAMLDYVATNPRIGARILEAAHDAFLRQHEWFYGERSMPFAS